MTVYTPEATASQLRLECCVIETNHRMKNNFQMISAMLDLQADAETHALSAEGVGRLRDYLRALVILHDLLAQSAGARSEPDRLSAQHLLDRLIPPMQNLATLQNIRYQSQEIIVPTRKARALAVITQELINNALKHGTGNIEVTLSQQEGEVVLEVCNDGPEFPHDFASKKMTRTGLELIEQFVHLDLKGTIRYENCPMTGVRVVVEFPIGFEN